MAQGIRYMIKLEGLTELQASLCEIMWALDSTSELNTFLMGLPDHLKKEAETLIQLMVMEELEKKIE